eukprot:981236_1
MSSQQYDLYRGNGIDLTSNPTATFTMINQLRINAGTHTAEISDFACTEIIVINQKIPLDDILCIENYLSEKYSTNSPTTSPTSPPSNAPSVPTTTPTTGTSDPTAATNDPTSTPTGSTTDPTSTPTSATTDPTSTHQQPQPIIPHLHQV